MKLIILYITLILILIFIPQVYASGDWINGTVEKNIDVESSSGLNIATISVGVSTATLKFWYESGASTGIVDIIKWTNIHCLPKGGIAWADIPQVVGGSFYINTNPITYGSVYFVKTVNTDYIDYWVDFNYPETQNFTDGTTYDMIVNMDTLSFYYNNYFCINNANSETPLHFTVHHNDYYYLGDYYTYAGTVYLTQLGTFKNDYSIYKEGYVLDLEVNKYFPTYTYTNSQVVIKNENSDIIYESGFSTNNLSISPGNYTYTYYIELNVDNSMYIILDNVGGEPDISTNPNLITDKDMYNYLDEITFNYTNLDNINDEIDSYDLITYCIDNQGNYKSLSGLHLNYGYDKYDGQTWFATNGYPYGDIYYGVIDHTLDYENNKNVIMSNVYLSNTIFIIPQLGNPYISITDKQDYYNNGNTIYYSYYTNLESNITIEDYNNEVITKILYVNGTGIGEYIIPYDDNKNYEYPTWSINISSYNDTYTVYWIEQDVIPYNPDYTPDVDPEIQANIDDIKDELEPIKDLIFGLSTIFLDNPDYDSNGIVDTEELSNWFNSIVMIIIVLTIYIFYKGLKRK